jgi:tetratricopeptide (TPR) repeat protein
LTLLRRGQFAAARDDFSGVLDLRPDHAEALHQRGHAYEGLKQPARAVEDFTAALKAQPRNAHLLECRARNCLVLQDYARAVRDLRRALAIKPDQPSACHTLAWVYLTGPADLRAPAEALRLADRATQLEPARWQHWQTLGLACYRLGKHQEALAALERGVKAKTGGPSAYDLLLMAPCHQRLGDKALAADCYEKALRWRDEHKGKLTRWQAETLEAFRAEAEAALAQPEGR